MSKETPCANCARINTEECPFNGTTDLTFVLKCDEQQTKVAAVIEFLCNNDDMTDEEIQADLEASGVDLDAFHARMNKVRDEGLAKLRQAATKEKD